MEYTEFKTCSDILPDSNNRSSMLSLLPIIFFVIIFFIFQDSTANDSWRGYFLKASLVWGIVLTGITEILSLFRLIAFTDL